MISRRGFLSGIIAAAAAPAVAHAGVLMPIKPRLLLPQVHIAVMVDFETKTLRASAFQRWVSLAERAFDQHGIHGVSTWERVVEIGQDEAERQLCREVRRAMDEEAMRKMDRGYVPRERVVMEEYRGFYFPT